MKKRIMAILLSAVMLLFLGSTAFAETADIGDMPETEVCEETEGCTLEAGHEGDCILESSDNDEETSADETAPVEAEEPVAYSDEVEDSVPMEAEEPVAYSDEVEDSVPVEAEEPVSLSNEPEDTADSDIASGICGDDLTWTLEDGVLTISGTGIINIYSDSTGGINYNYGGPWSKFSDQITTVVIEDGASDIGGYSFTDCTNLTSVVIPDSVVSIGYFAFFNCSSLTDVYYGGSEEDWAAVKISSENDCLLNADIHYAESEDNTCGDNLTWTLEDGVLTISGTGEMYDYLHIESSWNEICEQVTTVVLEDGVTSIGSYGFYGFSKLNNVTLPQSVTSIGTFAFCGCTSLNSITIPAGITNISWYTFYGCTSLTSVTIPNSVTFIGDYTFNGCDALTDVYYGGTEAEWANIYISDLNNDPLLNATIHYNAGSEPLEIQDDLTGEGAADKIYILDSNTDVTIHCSGALAYFKYVTVDGEKVAPDNYTLAEGSTLLTFKSSYLETLAPGEHLVALYYQEGIYAEDSISINLTVVDSSAAQPGEDNEGSANGSIIDGNGQGDSATNDTNSTGTTAANTNVTGTAANDTTAISTTTTGTTTTPQTGDSSNIALWVVLLTVSVGGMLALFLFSRKRSYYD